MRSATVRKIIRAYDDPLVRAYCWARFWILRQRFLDEIGQYLPAEGAVLDLGCGFGLFSLYYAATGPRRFLRGIDVNARRIALARRAAARLGIDNVAYEVADARHFKGDGEVGAAYMLDIVHHVPPETVAKLGEQRRHGLGRHVMDDVEHVGGSDFAVTLEVSRVGHLVGDVVDPEPGRGPARERDTPGIHVDAAQEPAGARRRIVEREESEPTAQIEHGALGRQGLADLVEEALAQDPEKRPAIGADERIIVGADGLTNRPASHGSRSRRP